MIDNKTKCYDLRKRITSLQATNNADFILDNPKQSKEVQSRIDAMKEEYKNIKCDAIINTERGQYVLAVTDIFSTLDKKRIQSDSIYERNKRVFFAGVVLVFGLAIIMTFKKEKK